MTYKTVYALAFLALAASSVTGQGAVYSQCGGQGWTGATTCLNSVCTVVNQYYSQCLPGSVGSTTIGTTTASTTSTSTTTTTKSTSTASTTITTASSTSTAIGPTGTCAPNSPAPGSGTLELVGVNIAGFDFGCNTDGSCTASAAYPPLTQYYGANGAGQMTHFVNDDGYNVFRLPVGWQFLTNNVLGGPIDAANMVEYDALVQACLATGASCIIDIHNYARWDGEIIGQGGPTNEQFAATWGSIAAMYKNESKIIFGVMNEPHDIPDINLWADSVQAAVTAIRNAGAEQMILLPGNDWTSAETFISNGSGPALSQVVNPDGSFKNLIFDVHKYLDSDNSGTHSECVTNNIEDAWAPLAQWLRCNGRQAFNTETGGGYNDPTCYTYMCQQIAYQAQNSDVFLGYVGWAAGNFYAGYVLSELPTQDGTTWTDTPLVSMCMAPVAGAQKGSTGL